MMTADQMKPVPDPLLESTSVLRAMAQEIRKSDDTAEGRARDFLLSRLSREQTLACAKALELSAGEIERLTFELESARQTFGRVKQSMREQYDARLTPAEACIHGRNLLWGWFNLSYASFLTLPRVLMHAMPDQWQGRMALLLEEYDLAWPGHPDFGFRVQAIKDKKLVKFPEWLLNYRRPDFDEIMKSRSPRPRKPKYAPPPPESAQRFDRDEIEAGMSGRGEPPCRS